jgi:hypothetical protein
MRRATVAAVGTLGLLIAIGLSAYAVAAPTGPTTHAFTGTVLGDVIRSNGTSFENAYKITSSADGTGAGWNDGSTASRPKPSGLSFSRRNGTRTGPIIAVRASCNPSPY